MNILKTVPYFVRLALVVCLLSSCGTTIRYCPIETLQPAHLSFEGSRKNIAICATQTILSEAINSNVTIKGMATDSLIANILTTLLHFWKDAPGFKDAQIQFFIHITPTDKLPEPSQFDLTVRLEQLHIHNSYYGQQYSFFEWEAYLYVNYAAKWTIHSKSGALVDEHIDRDVIEWSSGLHSGKAEAVMALPNVKDAWWDMGIALAQNYATRIMPRWKTGTRQIYMINKYPDLAMQAYKAMQNDAHARAFDIWENMLLSCRKNRQKKIKSQITYNMAVACEFQNQLEESIYWTQRSVNLNVTTRNAAYLNLLRERQRQQSLLDQQINTSPEI